MRDNLTSFFEFEIHVFLPICIFLTVPKSISSTGKMQEEREDQRNREKSDILEPVCFCFNFPRVLILFLIM